MWNPAGSYMPQQQYDGVSPLTQAVMSEMTYFQKQMTNTVHSPAWSAMQAGPDVNVAGQSTSCSTSIEHLMKVADALNGDAAKNLNHDKRGPGGTTLAQPSLSYGTSTLSASPNTQPMSFDTFLQDMSYDSTFSPLPYLMTPLRREPSPDLLFHENPDQNHRQTNMMFSTPSVANGGKCNNFVTNKCEKQTTISTNPNTPDNSGSCLLSSAAYSSDSYSSIELSSRILGQDKLQASSDSYSSIELSSRILGQGKLQNQHHGSTSVYITLDESEDNTKLVNSQPPPPLVAQKEKEEKQCIEEPTCQTPELARAEKDKSTIDNASISFDSCKSTDETFSPQYASTSDDDEALQEGMDILSSHGSESDDSKDESHIGSKSSSGRTAKDATKHKKPNLSYLELISEAIFASKECRLLLGDIYSYICEKYPYYKTAGQSWKNSIRHNLSIDDCFVKSGRARNGRGFYWVVHPACIDDFRNGVFIRRQARLKVELSKKLLARRPTSDCSASNSPYTGAIPHMASPPSTASYVQSRGYHPYYSTSSSIGCNSYYSMSNNGSIPGSYVQVPNAYNQSYFGQISTPYPSGYASQTPYSSQQSLFQSSHPQYGNAWNTV